MMNCNCIEEVNRKLQQERPGVVLESFINPQTYEPSSVVIAAGRFEGRGKVPPIAANYCPFCGRAYDKANWLLQEAAPDLLAALVALEPYLQTEAQMLNDASLNEGHAGGFGTASVKARKAIAKAKGE